MKKLRAVAVALFLLWAGFGVVNPIGQIEQAEAQGQVLATYTLPDIPLGEFQNEVLPGTIENDRNFLLGGVGSDLWRSRKDPRTSSGWSQIAARTA